MLAALVVRAHAARRGGTRARHARRAAARLRGARALRRRARARRRRRARARRSAGGRSPASALGLAFASKYTSILLPALRRARDRAAPVAARATARAGTVRRLRARDARLPARARTGTRRTTGSRSASSSSTDSARRRARRSIASSICSADSSGSSRRSCSCSRRPPSGARCAGRATTRTSCSPSSRSGAGRSSSTARSTGASRRTGRRRRTSRRSCCSRRRWSTSPSRRARRAGCGAGSLLAAVVVGVLYALRARCRCCRSPLAAIRSRARAGWDGLATQADCRAARRSARTSWVGADRYQDVSELAYHLPGRPDGDLHLPHGTTQPVRALAGLRVAGRARRRARARARRARRGRDARERRAARPALHARAARSARSAAPRRATPCRCAACGCSRATCGGWPTRIEP